MPNWVKGGLWGALLLTALWLLAPQRSLQVEEGVIEIRYMGRGGPIQGALEDAIREFERLSRERHAVDPTYPIYRVVSGQDASRGQTEDPTRFLVSLAGGTPPDVIDFDRFAISEWAARGAFTPLDDFIQRDREAWAMWESGGRQGLPPWPGAAEEPPRAQGGRTQPAIEPLRAENFYAACWDEAVYRNPVTGESAIYGIPSDADNRVLLYNKDILIRHGYTNESGDARPPRTWEELEEMAVRMTERDERGRIRTIGFIPNYGNSWLYMYGWQAGGEFLSADGRRVTLNDPPIVEALDFMTRIYNKLGGAQEVYAFQSTFQGGELDPFILGRVAMKIDGVWVMSSLAFYGRDLNFGAAPAPMPARELAKGRKPISWLAGWAYAIPSTAREKRGAWELIRFLTSQRAMEIMRESENFIAMSQGRPFIPRQYPQRSQNEWVFRTYVEANPALEPKFKEAMRVFNDLLDHSRYRPVTPVGQKLWNCQIWAMEDAIFGKKTPQAALDYYTAIAQRDLDEILNPPRGIVIRNWSWFFALYVALIAATAAWVYWRETRPVERRRIPRFSLSALFTGEKPDAAALEGSKGSYFRSEWRDGVLCALPWLLGFIIFTGGPMLFSVVISFCRFDVLNPAVFVGLKNYAFMVTGDELFWTSMRNTLFMVIGVPLGMAVSFGLALLLNVKVRGIAVWRTLFYLPSIVPAVASSILWIWIFNPQSGLLNTTLAALGIEGPNWLQDEDTSKWALILMGLWGAGGGMIIWLAGLKGISRSYYEAAEIDGANAWQQFRYITVPMMTPYIFFNLVMGLIGTFQIFTQAFIMTQGGPVNSTLFFAYHLFNNAFRYLHMGYAAAMAWFLFLIVVLITAFQMRTSKRWVHYEEDV
ncbi:MAG: extracellular solute-binding protein [Kiritimatiellae bacterium]|nr:extracellular solute-binding protein [Kiritimatiellia bacterium]MDW8457761.1 extracellular solute-binding protein [Verrucomicrobiota bacterium]